MSNPLNGIDADRWYLVWLAVSVVLLVASIAADKPLYAGLCAGLTAIGMGETINHPLRQGFVPGYEVTIRTRSPKFLGWLLDIVGVGLLCWFTYKLAVA
ncbi:hypothetical protein K9B35_14345 [Sphingomonas sp. R647]|uniref:hypothetical protein n=1 Tax=Sphingomonas sp. R647 TaxID=2875233 RepID=UPI001CD77134|nr:hypothetical protein [Sphingomonas sp. R647]MCA1199154.1 hypothetical protein [Sphingomonas sp. R647]